MAYLNGAALSNVWIYFDSLHELEYAVFSAFNKEI